VLLTDSHSEDSGCDLPCCEKFRGMGQMLFCCCCKRNSTELGPHAVPICRDNASGNLYTRHTDRLLLSLPLPCSCQTGVLLLLLAVCVLLPSIPGGAASPAQAAPDRTPSATRNPGIFSGRVPKGTGPNKVVGTVYPRSDCSGFTTGTLGHCDLHTHVPACCWAKKACMSVPGDASTSFTEKCDKEDYQDLACCPILAGGLMLLWNDVGCSGLRVAGPNPPRCPAQTTWACCLSADKSKAKGMAWDNTCLRFKSDNIKDCNLFAKPSYGCCPM
jgi:hypothetical protein